MMQSNLIAEIKQMTKKREEMGLDFPLPTYLYLQKYGRSVEGETEEISGLLGEENSFVFKTDQAQGKETVLGSFKTELEKHATPGKVFTGCVFVELSEGEEKELRDFFAFAAKQEGIKYVFYKQCESEEEKKDSCLKQYFFVRTIEGTNFTVEEQMILMQEMLGRYGFVLCGEAQEVLEKYFAQKEWQENDMVENLIRNMAMNLVYDSLNSETDSQKQISVQDVESMILQMSLEELKKNQIGFVY